MERCGDVAHEAEEMDGSKNDKGERTGQMNGPPLGMMNEERRLESIGAFNVLNGID